MLWIFWSLFVKSLGFFVIKSIFYYQNIFPQCKFFLRFWVASTFFFMGNLSFFFWQQQYRLLFFFLVTFTNWSWEPKRKANAFFSCCSRISFLSLNFHFVIFMTTKYFHSLRFAFNRSWLKIWELGLKKKQGKFCDFNIPCHKHLIFHWADHVIKIFEFVSVKV